MLELKHSKSVLLAFALNLMLLPGAFADQIADIDVQMDSDPIQVLGLVVGSNGTAQKADIKWHRVKPNIVSIQVPITTLEQKQASFVTALAVNDSGKIFFGPMKSAALIESLESFNELPLCPGKKIPTGLETKTGELQLLIDLRSQRRDFSQKKIAGKLSGKLLEKARTLEMGFGLAASGRPLSPDLHPLELSDRLTRLAAAIKNYKRQEAFAAAEAAKAAASAPTGATTSKK